MKSKKFILIIFFITITLMCLIFKKFCNKENFATGDLTDEQLRKQCPNNADGTRDWPCWYKHKGASAELYFDKVRKPCLNTDGETNEYRAAGGSYFNPTSDHLIKVNELDSDIQETINSYWEGKNKIDIEGKEVQKKQCGYYPKYLIETEPDKYNTKEKKEELWSKYYVCTGTTKGSWKAITKDEDKYDNLLQIFPKKRDDYKTCLIEKPDNNPYKKKRGVDKILKFNKFKFDKQINSNFAQKYLKEIGMDYESVDPNKIFWDTNNIDSSRYCNESHIDSNKGIKFIPQDFNDAHTYATAKLCIMKGYCLTYNKKGHLVCEFNKNQCKATSKQQDKKVGEEGKVKKEGTDQTEWPKYLYHEWRDNAGCINANEQIKKFCEEKNQCNYGLWKYDDATGECTMKKEYCETLGLELRDGKCKTAEGQKILEGTYGQTFTRNQRRRDAYPENDVYLGGCKGYKNIEGEKTCDYVEHSGRLCPPYRLEYKNLEQAIEKNPDAHGEFIQKCLADGNPTKNEIPYCNLLDPSSSVKGNCEKAYNYSMTKAKEAGMDINNANMENTNISA